MAKQVSNCGNCRFWIQPNAGIKPGFGACLLNNSKKVTAACGLLTVKTFYCNQYLKLKK